jgi:hypothetical protein
MTVKEVLDAAAGLPQEDLLEIQSGIAELITGRFSPEEITEINQALDEADAELERGEGSSSAEVRKQLGLK